MFTRTHLWLPSAVVTALQFLCAIAVPANAAGVPVDVFGRLPALEQLALSPDGKRIAFVRTIGDERQLVVNSLDDGKSLAGVTIGKTKFRDIKWADNDHVLVIVSSTTLPIGFVGRRSELTQLLIFDVEKKKLSDAMSRYSKDVTLNVIAGDPLIRRDGDETYLVVPGIYFKGRSYPALFRVGLSSGFAPIEKSDSDVYDWVVDAKGKVAAAARYRNPSRKWALRVNLDNNEREYVTGSDDIDIPSIHGLSPGGASVWMSVNEKGVPTWKSMSLKDGSLGEIPESISGFESVLRGRYDDNIIGAYWGGEQGEVRFFDALVQQYWSAFRSVVPGKTVTLVSYSDDFKRWIISVNDDKAGPVYLLADINSGNASRLGSAYSGLPELGEVQRVTYAAADGLPIRGFLTVPRNRPATNLPLVVLPHGGPEAEDSGGFDWWAQGIASQGYAVLQPNFRGSSTNMALLSAGFGQWGRKMQSDLTDGVAYLAEKGIVDPKRVCIVGASYGGYAALMGPITHPGVYRCAA
ncbi:MAG: prolyl oligopeptidase family serine peptidase, partial [Vicinamibacterales bacterium]